MATLVFDIETSRLPVEMFDEAQQEYLFREAQKLPEDQQPAKREEIARLFSLWPFTAQVVCIAMLNADTQGGQVLFQAEDFEEEAEKGLVKFVPCADEHELLTAFGMRRSIISKSSPSTGAASTCRSSTCAPPC